MKGQTGNICSVAAMFRSLRKHCVILRAVFRDLYSEYSSFVNFNKSCNTNAFFCTLATGLCNNSSKVVDCPFNDPIFID